MATRKKTATTEKPEPTELLVSREEAKSRLQDRIEKGLQLKQVQAGSRETFDSLKNNYKKWRDYNIELLKQLFTTSAMASEYSWTTPILMMGMHEPSLGEKIAEIFKDIDAEIHRLDSITERLELIPLKGASEVTASPSDADSQKTVKSKKVFVVHGHDEVAKTNLEVFLREIGLEPIVLHRQADEGLTIIEKFEKHSDVSYAFILLTPDDIAYSRADETKGDSERKKEFRARQNVIFEFGYFVGKLSRSRVCCLYTGDVAVPSDMQGMVYKPYGKSVEEVAYSIIKDLKAQGIIDS